MTDFQNGWAPAGRIRRPVALPESLDQEVKQQARKEHMTPGVYVSNVLGDAVEKTPGCAWNATKVQFLQQEPRVERVVVIDRAVYSVLSSCISNSELAFSDVAAAIVGEALQHYRNGNGNGNGS